VRTVSEKACFQDAGGSSRTWGVQRSNMVTREKEIHGKKLEKRGGNQKNYNCSKVAARGEKDSQRMLMRQKKGKLNRNGEI